ncbi:MAG: hypothetical protein QOG34_682 [Frankiaceae bacterium]|nr:hypothetical protein [Frankiaceae bacterium]
MHKGRMTSNRVSTVSVAHNQREAQVASSIVRFMRSAEMPFACSRAIRLLNAF